MAASAINLGGRCLAGRNARTLGASPTLYEQSRSPGANLSGMAYGFFALSWSEDVRPRGYAEPDRQGVGSYFTPLAFWAAGERDRILLLHRPRMVA
jgi:hypothetical protein